MLGHLAVGTWSGGRFMHFGEPISDDRLESLLRPGEGIRSVMTADAYGARRGRQPARPDASRRVALQLRPRGRWAMSFYEGEREGAKGYPRFTDPRLRGPDGYAAYLRMAVERSLERCGVGSFDLLLLHNPDRRGFEVAEVWEALRAIRDEGLTRMLGLAPGPTQQLHST